MALIMFWTLSCHILDVGSNILHFTEMTEQGNQNMDAENIAILSKDLKEEFRKLFRISA